ncbi:threonine ammonia-lyase IlvA [Maritalea porphyrae]|uniref:threonine ammonia-lyase IlvA n=1 Tax=Maritalea porphyrae TaxID=880732 RepID=UPI0022AF8167|nr:threonine ammonia-lyase IlvA [Maritalea porphyrae]MCZ4273271.1 threonine ammonia-lyase IlvA [Maritalea porphyrae]
MTNFIDNVATAKERMSSILDATPCQKNVYLSQKFDANIYLKREDLTPVRSYKLRGAYNFISKALDENPEHKGAFVCASAGNHAQGFAFCCAHFGVKGTIFMPVTTPQQKIDKTRAFGGANIEIKLIGDIFDQCYSAALSFADEQRALMVPPFDHADIIEGQATIAHEILEQLDGEPLDLIIMPVGGGGLAAGVTAYLTHTSPKTEILLVEPQGAPSLKTSLQQGKRVKLQAIDNFVDGAAVAQVGALNFEMLEHLPADIVTLVPENRLCATIVEMLNIEGMVLEPAGALSIDVLSALPPEKLNGKNIVCVTSGGNFDFERLPEVKEKALKYSGLKKYFILRMPQRPGALKDFLNMLGPHDDIARFEYLKKSARNFGTVLMGIETNDPANFEALKAKLIEGDFGFQDITENDLLSSLIV